MQTVSARLNWVDVWLFGYLAVVVAVYASGARLAAALGQWLGTMPVRGGVWTWAWSIDRVGSAEALRIIGGVLAGGLAAVAAERMPWPTGLGRGRGLVGFCVRGGLVVLVGRGV